MGFTRSSLPFDSQLKIRIKLSPTNKALLGSHYTQHNNWLNLIQAHYFLGLISANSLTKSFELLQFFPLLLTLVCTILVHLLLCRYICIYLLIDKALINHLTWRLTIIKAFGLCDTVVTELIPWGIDEVGPFEMEYTKEETLHIWTFINLASTTTNLRYSSSSRWDFFKRGKFQVPKIQVIRKRSGTEVHILLGA